MSGAGAETEARYARQSILPEVGAAGQRRLGEATVTVLGLGALGGVHAQLLARAGVGRLRLIDRDVVELQNLQRQVLFDEGDAVAALPKAIAARRRLERINSSIGLDARVVDVHAGNVEALIEGSDVVLDGTDNFETRYLLNDACVRGTIPWIYGGVIGTEGMCMPILPGAGPCLRCAFPEPPAPGSTPTCDTAGVLNTLPALVGAVQVTAALRLLVDGSCGAPALVVVEPWRGAYRTARVERSEGCPCCVARRFEFLDQERTSWTTTLCGRDAVQVTPPAPCAVDLALLAERLATQGAVTFNGALLKVRLDRQTLLVFPDGRTLVQGTTDPALARSLYSRLIGT